MAEFTFVSPSVKFSETDLTVTNQQLGVTALGLVGETLKGAAFDPIAVRDTTEFERLFGSTSTQKIGGVPKYPLPYAANNFLTESNNLTVTRVLGLTGYDAGKGWAIRMRGNPVKSSTTAISTSTSTFNVSYGDSVDYKFLYKGISFNNAYYNTVIKTKIAVQDFFSGVSIGESVEINDLFFKNHLGEFYAVDLSFTLNSVTGATTTGATYNVTVDTSTFDAEIDTAYDNTILGIIRSRADYSTDTLNFRVDTVDILQNYTPQPFSITVSSDTSLPTTTEVSSNEEIDIQVTKAFLDTNASNIIETETLLIYENINLDNDNADVTLQNSTSQPVDELFVSLLAFNKVTNQIVNISIYSNQNNNLTVNGLPAILNSDYIAISSNGSTTSVTVNTEYNGTTFDFKIGDTQDFSITTSTTLTGAGITTVSATTHNYYIGGVLDADTNSTEILFGFQNLDPTGSTQSVQTDNVINPFGDFKIKSSLASNVANTVENFDVTLDPDKRSYISKVLGSTPKDKNEDIWIETQYPDIYKKIFYDGGMYGIYIDLVDLETDQFSNYKEQYKDAETPWVLSELRGSKVERLFKFKTIGDGNSANKDIKITFQNINPDTKEFDVIIRDFNDTDANPIVLESYVRCTLDKTANNYIGKRIGAIDTETGDFRFDQRSDYVYLMIDDEHPNDAFPAGFEGYEQRSFVFENPNVKNPNPIYKTSYSTSDKVTRTYLGISETAYNSISTNGLTVNQNLFNYFGLRNNSLFLTKTKGFHMDSGVAGLTFVDSGYEIGELEAGADVFRIGSDVQDTNNAYNDRRTRKFTFVPYGGFDGWDEHRTTRTNTDVFSKIGSRNFVNSDYEAYLQAIRTMANPEEVEINLIATPNINWNEHLELVKETIEMVERERADSLYIIDPPDIKGSNLAAEIAELADFSDLDSNYSATYAPWYEIVDTNNSAKIFVPPSIDIVRAFARNDNRRFEWYVPAGSDYGALNALRTRKKLSEAERDTLYAERVNPIAFFNNSGVTVFGQKTLQQRESALDRINVRRLLLSLKKSISTIAVSLLFEPNDELVREEFRNKVTPILENVKNERGLFDYRLEDDGTDPEIIDRLEARFTLKIKPTRLLEYISVNFIITPTGASFDV